FGNHLGGFGNLGGFHDLHQNIHSLHNFHHRGGPNSDNHRQQSRSQRQQISLFDDFFSPMRMPFDSFGSDGFGTISSFNFTSDSNGSRPLAKKTTRSAKTVGGKRVVTTRVEENGQITEIVEEDGKVTSRKVNGVQMAIKS
ncbi:unnamed protein product, partial [Didymodactylos carnosus]